MALLLRVGEGKRKERKGRSCLASRRAEDPRSLKNRLNPLARKGRSHAEGESCSKNGPTDLRRKRQTEDFI